MVTRPVISVLLPVRNETLDFRECLESVNRQTYPADRLEVVILDASDTPIDLDQLGQRRSRTLLIRNEAIAMSPGLNLGAQFCRGDYLAILSAHSSVPSDYLERALETAERTAADNVGGKYVKAGRARWGKASAAATSSPFGIGNASQHFSVKPGPADSAFPGFIRRRAFDGVGGFDPRLACNEDDEFNARLRERGGIVWYDPSLRILYRPREHPSTLWLQYYRYGRWKVIVARTGVPGYLRWHHFIPMATLLSLIFVFLAAAVWTLAAVLLVGGTLAYIGAAVIEGHRVGPRHEASPIRTAVLFPLIHSAYALGFLRGLLDRRLPPGPRTNTALVGNSPRP